MTKIFNSKFKTDKQAGVTLLLAVLIVSAVSLIALSVSVLAVQSIRNSRANVLSEPAIGAAHSGAEEGVWTLKRTSNCGSAGSTASSENLSAANVWTARNFSISNAPATVVLTANTPYMFSLYDPCDPNSDFNLSNMPGGGYHCMTFNMLSGTHNIDVNVTRLDGTPVGNPPPAVTVSPGSSSISSCSGVSVNRTITNLAGSQSLPPDDSTEDNRMLVTLEYYPTCVSSCSSETATVVIDTDVGMPTFPTVDSTGCAQKGLGSGTTCNAAETYNRKIQVTVPR